MTQTVENLRARTIEEVEKFLKDHPRPVDHPIIEPTEFRTIDGSVDSYTDIIKSLGKAMDAHCGIVQYEIDGPVALGQIEGEGASSKITIRDARAGNSAKPENIGDSWWIAMAAQARGAASLIDMDKSGADRAKKDMTQRAIAKTFAAYCEKTRGAESPKERKKIAAQFNQEMAIALKTHGVRIGDQEFAKMSESKLTKVMADARDFANFGEEAQNHTVSISREVGDRGSLVWASLKVNPLSDAIKKEYEEVKAYRDGNRDTRNIKKDTPKWFQDLSPIQRALTMKYVEKIMDGNHAIPTQLRFLPGLKNAFMDVKGMAKGGKIIDDYVELHNGTLAHGAGAKDNTEARRVTTLNLQHAKGLVEGKELVVSVLNSNTIFQRDERNICRMTEAVSKDVDGVKFHQNGVNGFAWSPDKSMKRLEELGKDVNGGERSNRILSTMCKSGKDRTFGVMMRTAATIFGGKDEEKQKEFIKIMADTGHAEAMAAGAGATRGAFGLKLKDMFIRLGDKLLGAVKGRLVNSICGVNSMRPAKLKGKSVYEQQLANVQQEWEPGQAQGNAVASDPIAIAKRMAAGLEEAGLIAKSGASPGYASGRRPGSELRVR